MTRTKRIIRNAIQCRQCWDIIESQGKWESVRCSCGSVTVDGGHHFLKRTFKNCGSDNYIELSEYE